MSSYILATSSQRAPRPFLSPSTTIQDKARQDGETSGCIETFGSGRMCEPTNTPCTNIRPGLPSSVKSGTYPVLPPGQLL